MIVDSEISTAITHPLHESNSYTTITSNRARRILSEQELIQFREQGFLSVTTIAAPSDMVEVSAIIDGLFVQTGSEHGLLDCPARLAPQLKACRVFRSCEAIAKQVLGRTALYAFDKAIYKPPFDTKGTLWHQDQALHGNFFPMNTLHFWFPLQPLTKENGCKHYISGSHTMGLLPHYRFDPSDPYTLITDHIDYDQEVICPLLPGDGVLHLPLTLHSALPNTTASIRRVWALLFRPVGRLGRFNPIPCIKQCWKLRSLPSFMVTS
jgi:ectoine hydroxylase-related dioxygenase (phytanoyl-CoA dioxygenase family)